MFNSIEEFDNLYEELVEISHKIRPYYDVDKVKSYSVYIWTKGDLDNSENVFDIMPNEIVFYVKDHEIIEEAMPIIEEIQAKLRELNPTDENKEATI